MLSITQQWNPDQKKLKQLLSSSDAFDEAIILCSEMHNQLHDLKKGKAPTLFQSLVTDLSPTIITYRPTSSFSSIAWDIWHITRIEDAITNILIADSDQILTREWLDKMHIQTTDTGNAFTKDDVDKLDGIINTSELLNYRRAVGKNTHKVLQNIKATDKKRKPTQAQLRRITSEKVLTRENESLWLLDFWANKTIAGLLTMPITRHQIVHINDCFKLKEKYIKAFG